MSRSTQAGFKAPASGVLIVEPSAAHVRGNALVWCALAAQSGREVTLLTADDGRAEPLPTWFAPFGVSHIRMPYSGTLSTVAAKIARGIAPSDPLAERAALSWRRYLHAEALAAKRRPGARSMVTRPVSSARVLTSAARLEFNTFLSGRLPTLSEPEASLPLLPDLGVALGPAVEAANPAMIIALHPATIGLAARAARALRAHGEGPMLVVDEAHGSWDGILGVDSQRAAELSSSEVSRWSADVSASVGLGSIPIHHSGRDTYVSARAAVAVARQRDNLASVFGTPVNVPELLGGSIGSLRWEMAS